MSLAKKNNLHMELLQQTNCCKDICEHLCHFVCFDLWKCDTDFSKFDLNKQKDHNHIFSVCLFIGALTKTHSSNPLFTVAAWIQKSMSLSVMVAKTDSFYAVLQQKQVDYDEFINNCLMLQYYWQHAKYNRTFKKNVQYGD